MMNLSELISQIAEYRGDYQPHYCPRCTLIAWLIRRLDNPETPPQDDQLDYESGVILTDIIEERHLVDVIRIQLGL
jgi:hypothetical protein